MAAEDPEAAAHAEAVAQRATPLEPQHEWLWRAWNRLSQDRPWIAGGLAAPVPGRIPWSTVADWCERQGYTDDERDFMDAVLEQLDADYLGWWRAQAEQKAKERRKKRG